MKKIVAISLFIMASLAVFAAPRSSQKALQEAKKFLQSKGLSRMAQLKMSHQAPLKSGAKSEASLYVFNAADNQGFVIVSGDDAAPTILGYSDSGSFDVDQLPEHIKAWFEGYASDIALISQGKAKARQTGAKKVEYGVKKNIPEMLTCRWNQDAPYYNLCPTDAGGTCVTGCVATAMAQVMYYHRAKSISATTAEIPSYTPYGSSTTFDGVAANAPIDWANMIDVYNSSATDAQNTAVAQLMSYCGRSVEMTYSSNSSGAQTEMIPTALKKYFRYAEATRADYRINYDADTWDQMLYDELAAGRPVLYAGNSVGGGHQFVIDGYDTDGLFHVNWGWGGMSNGYFVISILNPDNNSGIGASSTTDGYSMAQVAIFGAEPAEISVEPEVNGALKAGLNSIDGNTAYYHFWNQTGAANKFYFGLSVQNVETGKYTLMSYYTSGSNDMVVGVGYRNTSFNITASVCSSRNLSPGTYRLVPVSCLQSESSLYPCQLDCNDIAYLDYDGTTATLYINYAGADLVADPIEFNGFTYINNNVNTDITVKNNATKEYNGMVYLFASTSSDMGNVASKTNIVVRPQGETDLTLTFKPTTAGTYNVWITTDEKGQNIIGQTTVEVTDGSGLMTNNSGLSITSYDLDNVLSGSTILGNKLSGKYTVKNTSDKIFSGNVLIRLWYVDWDANSYRSNVYDISSLTIQPGETAEIPFVYDNLDYDTNYGISLRYAINNANIGSIYGYYTLKEAIKLYTSDGEQLVASSATLTVPSDALAVDLRDVSGVTTIVPNSNPNTLYYIDTSKSNPSGFDALSNVVSNGYADNLYLSDGYDFFIPSAFHAGNGHYDRLMSVSTNGSGGWQTLVLPFNVSQVRDVTASKDIDWFHSATDADKDFWVKEFTKIADDGTVYFDYADRIEANTPYIVAVPGNRWGAEWDLTNHKFYFMIESGALVQPTEKICLASPLYKFEGTTASQSLTDVYALNAEGTNFALQSSATMPAFRAWFRDNSSLGGGTSVLRIAQIGGENQGETTGILSLKTVDSTSQDSQKWFTIDGRQLQGEPSQRGVYILNGKKIKK